MTISLDGLEIRSLPSGNDLNEMIEWHIFGNTLGYSWVPEYSENIKDAWEVLEWMVEEGIFFSLTFGTLEWTLNFCTKELWNNLLFESASAETAPLAICRAALLAKKQEEKRKSDGEKDEQMAV